MKYQVYWTRVITEKVEIEAPDYETAGQIASMLPLTQPRQNNDFSRVEEEFINLRDNYAPIDKPKEMAIHGSCHLYLRQIREYPDCVAIYTDGEPMLEPCEIARVVAFLKSIVRPRRKGNRA